MKISGGNTALFQTARGIQPLSSSQELAQASKVPIQLTTATFEAFLLKDPGLPIYLYLYVPHAAGAQMQFHLSSRLVGAGCQLLRIHGLSNKSNLMHSVGFPFQHNSPRAMKCWCIHGALQSNCCYSHQ